ncbi:hypothetical protein [Hyphomonas sp.]|uniref:hypothetical protein n=1 Tax=Hyphomonas sp. TaxID=87 RepID=UPI0025C216F2|nr:hypothetical protein [Hyphomonas sp.]
MSVPFISNLGFTAVDSAGTLNTKAGSKDALPVQFYRLTADITGTITINNNANHKKIILDINDRNLLGASGTGTASTPIVYNGTGTVELKGGGLVSSGGTLAFSSGSRTGTVTVSPSSTGGTNLGNMAGNVATTVTSTTSDTTGQDVILTMHAYVNSPASGNGTFRFGGYFPRVPSGVTIVTSTGTLGPGSRLSTSGGSSNSGSGTTATTAQITQIFGANASNFRYTGTTPTGFGGTYTNAQAGSGGTNGPLSTGIFFQGFYQPPGSNDPGTNLLNTFKWDYRGALVCARGNAGTRSGFNITTAKLINQTLRVSGRTFAVTNSSGGQITYTTPTGNTNIASGATANIATTNNTSEAFSFTGSRASVLGISATGSGNATVATGDGGDGATGTVVISISGSNFTVTNNNDNPINFVAGTGSGNVGATATAVIVGSGTSWSYTGQKPAENASNQPVATGDAFGGTGVTNNSDGEPTAGIDTSNYTGEFNRTP